MADAIQILNAIDRLKDAIKDLEAIGIEHYRADISLVAAAQSTASYKIGRALSAIESAIRDLELDSSWYPTEGIQATRMELEDERNQRIVNRIFQGARS